MVALCSSYSRCLEKTSRFKNHVVFSARCKTYDVIPPSLRIRSPIDTTRGREIAERASRQFLSERLRVANFKLLKVEEERKWTEIGLQRRLKKEDYEQLTSMSQDHAEKIFLEMREKQCAKFARISETRQQDQESCSEENSKSQWVINLSRHELTAAQHTALQRGLNFSDRPTKVPKEDIVVGVEAALQGSKAVHNDRIEEVRAAVARFLRTAKTPRPNTTPGEREALKELKNNKEIVILRADKGNMTVVLDADDYEKKVMDLLGKPPFKLLRSDPTKRNENRVNDRLKKLLKDGKISKDTYLRLRVSADGSRTPLFYGTVKVHKPDKPLRPIVSAVGAATYNISKFVAGHLRKYVQDAPSFIIDTKDFVDKLKDIRVSDDEILVSFDVKSLFTSVPVQDAIDVIREVICNDDMFEQTTSITTDTMMELLRISLASTSFQFRGKHYELQDGLAMGSPLSPAVANIFMTKLEERALEQFVPRPSTWHRFVDDVFSVVKKHAVNNLLQHLNGQHPAIHFTMEVEEHGQLPFLDLSVRRREEGLLSTTIYKKPTHTGRYLNFNSNVPTSVKRSVALSVFRRRTYLTAGEKEKKEEEKRIMYDLERNGFPTNFIQTSRRYAKKRDNPSTDTSTTTATIPYVQGTTEAIARVLRLVNVRTVSTSRKRKWSLMTGAKDPLPSQSLPGVVYAMGCTECPRIYIGETKRTAGRRAEEHQAHLRKGNADMSAVAYHAIHTQHAVHWKPQIIGREVNDKKRKIREALLIS